MAVGWADVVCAESLDEEDLALAYGDRSFVTIATGSRLPVSRAPSVATVITAEEIQAIGASDLDEVLESVPGLHVSRGAQTNMPVYVVRGIHRDSNPQVLMLVNGLPVTTSFAGNRGNVWGGLPIENVARIEVIRGPGSALYGADAFAGVINIITKTAADINGSQFGVRAGSFGSGDAWMLHGGALGPLEVAAYLRVGTTDGAKRTVARDAQTGWDGVFGTSVSRAPGPMNNSRDSIDGSLDLSHSKWRFRAAYKERDHVGSGSGVASALDPNGNNYSQRLTSDLTWQDASFAKDWDVTVQGSILHYKEFSDLTLFPSGAFNGAFADGMIGNPYKWERHGRLQASAFYTGLEFHRIRLGAGLSKDEIYRIRETKNFNPNFSPIGTGSVADITDVSDTAPFLRPRSRLVRYWFAQDEWNFTKDWTLTAGLRQDRYSDFGSTVNPRLALVWEAAYNVTAKVLYGSAFRAPSFTELYNINNPVWIGNPALTPEKIKTVEATVSWQPVPRLQLGVNAFRYRMSDIIRQVNFAFENSGKQVGGGMELEAAWDATKALRLSGNYAYQRSIDEATQQDAGNAPRHHAYLRTDWRYAPGWSLSSQLNIVGERLRAPGDTRAPLSGYATVDLTLRANRGPKAWSFAGSVRNLFNADAREPSAFDQGPAQPFISIPGDFPLPGRSFYVQASYTL
jgi:iron complex outermembrane receptor protein